MAKWFGFIVVGILSSAMTLLGTSWRSAQAVEASGRLLQVSRIHLVDKDGKPRLVLAVEEDGQVGITFADAEGRYRASLGVNGDGLAALNLRDASGKKRLTLMAPASKAPALIISATETTPGVVLSLSDENGGIAGLYGGDGKQIWAAY